jgi:hypothetical protein
MRKRLILGFLCFSVLTAAQNQLPSGARGTLTRSADHYKGLETDLLEAQQDKNKEAVARLVSDDFEIWSAEHDSATPRRVWEQGWMRGNISWFRIRNISVREFGDLAIVSFLLDRRGQAGNAPLPATYVIDVWNQSASKLVVRYVSTPLKPAAQLTPAAKE